MDVIFHVNIFSDESDSDEDLEDFVNVIFRRPRILHNRPNHLNYWDDTDFVNRFRLSKNTVQFILNLIENRIRYPTERNSALSPLQQFLLCLRFYASGSFMISIGDHAGVHKSTVSNIIRRVTQAICLLKNDYVKLPEGQEIIEVQQGFFNVARFPKVVLVLDGTHIKIQSPGGDQAEWFRNRKGYFSINTMVACDQNLKIRNIVCRWPGSANDMIVFMNSALKRHFTIGMENCLMIGDSGYAVERYLMTPLENPHTAAELIYQESLVRTRNLIERCIGIWKRRFPCLALGLRTKLELSQDIIVATSILHNFARSEGEPDIGVDEEIELQINEEVPENNFFGARSDAYRRELIQEYFSRL